MRFSEVFFDAFGISRDRVVQWQFVTILLRLQERLEVGFLKLRSDKQFKALVDSLKYETRDYAIWAIFDGCRNEEGPFVERPQDRTKNRTAKLNNNFSAAAARHVEAFRAKLGLADSGLGQLEPVEAMKCIFSVLNDDYYPVWRETVARLAKHSGLDDPSEVRDELLRKAPYWVLVLTAWRRALGDRSVATDKAGLWRAAYDTLRGADPDELNPCVNFLSGDEGPKILIRSRQNKLEVYSINPKYNEPLSWYGNQIFQLNRSLEGRLLNLSNSYVEAAQ
jgi:hypothetical protein